MRTTVVLLLMLLLAACDRDSGNPAPPRDTTPAAIPVQQSHVVVPVSVSIGDLEAKLNAEIPPELYTIDKQEKSCVKAQKIGKLKITPDIGCHIIGAVQRGPIRIHGDGETLRMVMPVDARVSARDIAGIIKSETATAAAEVHATIKLDLTPDWQPRAKVDIDYDWTEKPGIDFLGQRITFADKADAKLADVVARLERDIPRHLAELHPRTVLERAWASGFTSVELNRRNPPVWLRITPQRLSYGGYSVERGTILLRLAVTANTETFVGDRPTDPPATPLPPSGAVAGAGGFHFRMPVVADYQQLEPVLAKALGKLAKKGISLPEIGAVDVKFGKVTMYATGKGRMAIGLDVRASTPGQLLATHGTVWLTGIPYNIPGNQRVFVRDLTVTGTADTTAGRLLLAIATAPTVQAEIASAVSHDFVGDFGKLLIKIDKALTDKRVGAFVLNAKVTEVHNGVLVPVGQGIYLPVEVSGTGELRYSPLVKPGA